MVKIDSVERVEVSKVAGLLMISLNPSEVTKVVEVVLVSIDPVDPLIKLEVNEELEIADPLVKIDLSLPLAEEVESIRGFGVEVILMIFVKTLLEF